MKSKIESAFEKIVGGLPTTVKVTFERINLSQLRLQQNDTSISIVSKDRQTNKILLNYYKYPAGMLFWESNIPPNDWKSSITRLETAPIVARTDKRETLRTVSDLHRTQSMYVDATRQIQNIFAMHMTNI
jgi:hypothetical protein